MLQDNDPEGSIPHAPKAKVLTTVDVNDVVQVVISS
jgi:hypothetical protein